METDLESGRASGRSSGADEGETKNNAEEFFMDDLREEAAQQNDEKHKHFMQQLKRVEHILRSFLPVFLFYLFGVIFCKSVDSSASSFR
jgi:hypothetical protein